MALKVHVVCIDFQNDFMDPNGSLAVKGATADAQRAAKMIERLVDKISDIHVTMDSHRKVDISHPMWWTDDNGNPPPPFTMIKPEDIDNNVWRPKQLSAKTRTRKYLADLQASNRYPHVIWPEHCLIGDAGHNLQSDLAGAIHKWEQKRYAMANVVTKGSNPWTEHFSAIRAEVPDPADPSTQLNRALIQTFEDADVLIWTGEALSHCLANTFRDTVAAFSDPSLVKKMYLLTDATSNVAGFENFGDSFIKEMVAKGMQLSTTSDILT